ncbi:hypothetical protein C0J45_10004 [Silurus meridionalis]|nr:hypothetical protein C0J45_10004 [Silurus meridionalis]
MPRNVPWSGENKTKKSSLSLSEIQGAQSVRGFSFFRRPSANVCAIVLSFAKALRVPECRSVAVGFLNDDTLYTSHARPDNSELEIMKRVGLKKPPRRTEHRNRDPEVCHHRRHMPPSRTASKQRPQSTERAPV